MHGTIAGDEPMIAISCQAPRYGLVQEFIIKNKENIKVIKMRFKDKVALVTGGKMVWGKAVAMRLLGEGAYVAVGDMTILT